MKVNYAIIGAGICGSMLSYFLRDENILLIDKFGICEGASKSAGAFLSPMVGKTNKIKLLVDKALPFALKFYKNLKLDSFIQNGLLKLPRDDSDIKKFIEYEEFIKFKYRKQDGGFFFPDGSILSPKEVCFKVTKNIAFLQRDIKNIKYIDNHWLIDDDIEAKNLILATGFEELIDINYIKIRPVWGQKIDIKSSSKVPFNIHKNLSISTTKENSLISIGATHKRYKTKGKADRKVSKQLIEDAKEMYQLSDIKLINEFTGVRAGSIDFMPLIGDIINLNQTIDKYPNIKNGLKIKDENLIKEPNLFIFNGVGGRGFVLAPLLAKNLSEFLINKKEIKRDLKSDRLFYKWARKII